MRTPLGSVIGHMKMKPEHPEDDVIDNDLILVWGEQKRIITGADSEPRGFNHQTGTFGRSTRTSQPRITMRSKSLISAASGTSSR
jgi:hypothetical protein